MTMRFLFKGDSQIDLINMALYAGVLVPHEDGSLTVPEEAFIDPWPGKPGEWETGIPIIETPAQFDADGNLIAEAVMKDGFHVNVEIWGAREARETNGFPQTDADGNLLPLIDRCRFGAMMKQIGTVQEDGTVLAVVGEGVWMLAPETIATPQRVKQ